MSRTLFSFPGVRLGLLLAACAAAFAVAGAQTSQPAPAAPTDLHLASTPWLPFTSTPDKPRFAVDLVNEALKRIGVTGDTTIVADGTLTDVIKSGKFAGSAAIWKDAERETYLIYSEPYLENRLILVGRHGSDVSATSLAELAGKRVALIKGFSYGDGVSNVPGVKFIIANGVEDGLQKLLAGEVDYTLNDELVVDYLVQSYPEQTRTRLAIGTFPLAVRPLHLALRRNLPGAQSIIERFNKVLTGMVADHSYHRLLHIPWIAADVDGDGKTEYIPADDKVATEAPISGYKLFTAGTPDEPQPATPAPKRYYIGGSIYEEWASVPDAFKVRPPGAPAPLGGNAASLFTIKW